VYVCRFVIVINLTSQHDLPRVGVPVGVKGEGSLLPLCLGGDVPAWVSDAPSPRSNEGSSHIHTHTWSQDQRINILFD
jgi:hypothetical protein